MQACRDQGDSQGREMELPLHRLREMVSSDHAGMPDLRIPPQGMQAEAITGICACT